MRSNTVRPTALVSLLSARKRKCVRGHRTAAVDPERTLCGTAIMRRRRSACCKSTRRKSQIFTSCPRRVAATALIQRHSRVGVVIALTYKVGVRVLKHGGFSP